MNNFIEVIRSLCLIVMCYQLAKAIIPAPIFDVLMQMILSPFTLTRAIIWSIVDFLRTACFKEAWGNLKECWKIQSQSTIGNQNRDRQKQPCTSRNRGRTVSADEAPLKGFCPSRRAVRSKKDLTGVAENVKFQVADEFARVHALLQSLDDKDAPTARFLVFVRQECSKIANAETLPQSSQKARACGVEVEDLWDKVIVKAQRYFTAAKNDIFASLQEL